MKEIKSKILNKDQISYSQFTNLLTKRGGVKINPYYKSYRHKGGNLANEYFKPISLITLNFHDETIF